MRALEIVDRVDWGRKRALWGRAGTCVRSALLAALSDDRVAADLGSADLQSSALYAGELSEAAPAALWCVLEVLATSPELGRSGVFDFLLQAVISTGSMEATTPDGRRGPAEELCRSLVAERQRFIARYLLSNDIEVRRTVLEIIDALQQGGRSISAFCEVVEAMPLPPEVRREYDWFRGGGFGLPGGYPGQEER